MSEMRKRLDEIDKAVAEAIRIREAMEEEIDSLNLVAARLLARKNFLLSTNAGGNDDDG